MRRRLFAATLLALMTWRGSGATVRIGRGLYLALFAAGPAILVAALFSRLPLSTWIEIPFQDDYTPLFPAAPTASA